MPLPSVSIMLDTAQAIVIEQQKKIHALEAELADKNRLISCQQPGSGPCLTPEFPCMKHVIAAMKARIQDLETRARVKAVLTFKRRVDELWVTPSKSIDYTAHPDGTPYIYTPFEYESPGLFPAVIVPRQYVGRVILIRGEDEH